MVSVTPEQNGSHAQEGASAPARSDGLGRLRAVLDACGLAGVPLVCGPGGLAPGGRPGVAAPHAWAIRVGLWARGDTIDGAVVLDVQALDRTRARLAPTEEGWRVVLVRPDGHGGAQVAHAIAYRRTGRTANPPRVARTLDLARRAGSWARELDWIPVLGSRDASPDSDRAAGANCAHAPHDDFDGSATVACPSAVSSNAAGCPAGKRECP